jgi:hypothetical protein
MCVTPDDANSEAGHPTSPVPTGSGTIANTMGIVLVVCFSTTAPGAVMATMTSALLSTSSRARLRNRSSCSAGNRCKNTTFLPST